MMKIAVGVDIGGTNTKIALVSEEGKVLDFTTFPTLEPEDFPQFAKQVRHTVDQLLERQHNFYSNLIGVGVGAPNGNGKNGFIENPTNLKKWGTVDLVSTFKRNFPDLPVMLDNDANVAALGECVWGIAKGMHDFIIVTLGTGVGTGVIVNGQLVRGVNGLAGEGGHIIIENSNRQCGCGGFGHLETYASVKGIKTTTKEICGKDLSFKEISELYHQGDAAIHEVFAITARHLGKGLATMGSLLAPQMIVLAGGVATIGKDFAKQVERHYNELVFPTFKNATRIEISTVSTSEGAVLGAAGLLFFR